MHFQFRRFVKNMAPIAALAVAAGVAGCGADASFSGGKGVPLAELDLAGAPPTGLSLIGPDNVLVKPGDIFSILVDGDRDGKLRFHREDGTLAISREEFDRSRADAASVTIIMPAPRQLLMAGYGTITAQELAQNAEVTIAGAGTAQAQAVSGAALSINIAGSGGFIAGGQVDRLTLDINGSGDAKMAGLKANSADVSIAGSGDAEFASDGEVAVNIQGSGNVTVFGNARCTLNNFGSGSVKCARTQKSASDPQDNKAH